MGHKKEVVAAFAKCFRLIAMLSVTIDDAFFVSLLNQESEKLLDCYIKFLKCEGTVTDNVAQCRYNLILQIKSILNLLNIIKHVNLSKSLPCLILERNLLYLESLVLDFRRGLSRLGLKNTAPKRSSRKIIDESATKKLGTIHNEIADFLGGKDKVQNSEVFIKFSYITRRTLKRKLSELISAGTIKRITLGKKVFYQGRGGPR